MVDWTRDWVPLSLAGVCIAAAVARVTIAWADLPLVVASHYDALGRPDGRMARDAFFIALGVALGLALVVTMLCPLLLRYLPSGAINLPYRDYWLAPERRDASIARLEALLAWFVVPLAAFEALVVHLAVEANLRRGAMDASGLWLGLALLVGSFSFLTVQIVRQFGAPPAGEKT